MEILALGLNHRTAPVEVRERFHVPAPELQNALVDLCKADGIDEAMLLSTCNRVEAYAAVNDALGGAAAIEVFLAARGRMTPEEVRRFALVLTDGDAVRHIFRVAASLDSLVIGEPQILGQVKAAFEAARGAGTIGPTLSPLLERAFAAAKRARSETGIGATPVSVPSVAVELVRGIFADLGDRTALVLGAGEMAELTARHLVDAGIGAILVASRSLERAESLAAAVGGRSIPIATVEATLEGADVLICSTGAPHYVVTPPLVRGALRRRRNRPVLLIDIAVPRNIDPACHALENVYLYDVDDLQAVVQRNLRARAREAERAEAIVAREAAQFVARLRSLDVVPVIAELRRKVEAIGQTALARALVVAPDLTPGESEVIRTLAARLVNKILHEPIVELKARAAAGDGPLYAEALRRFFGLEQAPAAGSRQA